MGRMNRIFRMKIQDAGRRDKRCRFKRAPTGPAKEKKKNQDTLFHTIKLCFLFLCTKSTRRFSVMFPSRKRKWLTRTWRKIDTLRRQQTARENSWKCLTSLFRKREDNKNKSGHHICYKMFTRTMTAFLDGRFFIHAIRIIPSILYVPTILISELWIKKRALRFWTWIPR